jgi:N-glycosylase/DNA lyase
MLSIRQTSTGIEWESILYKESESISHARIGELFRLDTSLESIIETWRADECSELAAALDRFGGLRVMRQDPFVCLISFLASPAAPIARIRRNLGALCKEYGRLIGAREGVFVYDFPPCGVLSEISRAEYDRCGFGFRGKSIALAASFIEKQGGEEWVRGLGALTYEDARSELCSIPGVGPKIADCVCLFALGFDQASPIDTHMARAATRLFGDAAPKSLSGAGYDKARLLYRMRFGEYAGWAQQYLYLQAISPKAILLDSAAQIERVHYPEFP